MQGHLLHTHKYFTSNVLFTNSTQTEKDLIFVLSLFTCIYWEYRQLISLKLALSHHVKVKTMPLQPLTQLAKKWSLEITKKMAINDHTPKKRYKYRLGSLVWQEFWEAGNRCGRRQTALQAGAELVFLPDWSLNNDFLLCNQSFISNRQKKKKKKEIRKKVNI